LKFYFGVFFFIKGSVPTTTQGFRKKKKKEVGECDLFKGFFLDPKLPWAPPKKKHKQTKKKELKLPYLDHTFLACCQYILDFLKKILTYSQIWLNSLMMISVHLSHKIEKKKKKEKNLATNGMKRMQRKR
jgi:hypothetical protein